MSTDLKTSATSTTYTHYHVKLNQTKTHCILLFLSYVYTICLNKVSRTTPNSRTELFISQPRHCAQIKLRGAVIVFKQSLFEMHTKFTM